MQSDLSVSAFAKVEGIPVSTLSKKASNERWIGKRKTLRQEITVEAAKKYIERNSDELAHSIVRENRLSVDIAKKTQEHIQRALQQATLSPSQIRTIVLAAKAAQDLARTALGLNSAMTPEEALEQIKKDLKEDS